ncbi:MAG: glycosyl hydrolase family 8 [Thermodesulfovibrio sp.]|nr:glycosyl hydrolase family 8 [Thermodesulfovibrio sp.]
MSNQNVLGFNQEWELYKKIFISHDGRVIDFQNNSISHSEGQGYGMLLSLMFNDIETFEKLWNWTKNNLKVRKTDNLLSWSWGKHISGKWTILDYNNATDGDILVAYGLCLAYKNWGKSEYLEEAKKIIKDIKALLILKNNDSFYLLPGYFGFYKDDLLIINPSYYVLPAFKAFSECDDKDFWNKFFEKSLNFLMNLNFGDFKLPADWVIVKDGKSSVFYEKNESFGIEAIRIILYSAMINDNAILNKFSEYLNVIEKIGYVPMKINLKTNEISPEEGAAFQYFIASLLADKTGKKELAESLRERGYKKLEEETQNYYSYTLSLISKGVK